MGNSFEDLDRLRLGGLLRAGPGPRAGRGVRRRGRVALGGGLDFGAPGDGFVGVTIGTSSALLAGIVDRMAAAAAG